MVGGEARTKLRYRWSHRHPLHRAIVRAANRVLPYVPFQLKYSVTDAMRRRQLPYSLIGPGSVVIQVGAPRDTLLAGRSRAMAFARRTQPAGRVLVVEPDAVSAEEFRRVAQRHGMNHVDVVRAAAWFEPGSLTMEVDPRHPATNFTAGTADYEASEVARFEEVTVPAERVDDLIDKAGLGRIDVVSITTNGAERQILRGLERTIGRDHPYLCLARTENSYADVMGELGYSLIGEDDRGFTFHYEAGRR